MGYINEFVRMFAETWAASLEFRIAVFVVVLQCSVMAWATSMVREIMRTTATVLCRLLVYDSVASGVPCNRSANTDAPALGVHRRHKTAGGPPPGNPPSSAHPDVAPQDSYL